MAKSRRNGPRPLDTLLFVPIVVACVWFSLVWIALSPLRRAIFGPHLDGYLRRNAENWFAERNPGLDPKHDRAVLFDDGQRWRRWGTGEWHVEPDARTGTKCEWTWFRENNVMHVVEEWTDVNDRVWREEFWTDQCGRILPNGGPSAGLSSENNPGTLRPPTGNKQEANNRRETWL